jgi:hypothetical protein
MNALLAMACGSLSWPGIRRAAQMPPGYPLKALKLGEGAEFYADRK